MTGVNLHRWLPLDEDGRVLWMKYSFGPGTANSLAVMLNDKTWMVISPASDAPESAYRALEERAPVGALVAPNPYHNLGQPAWRNRFPGALSYAPKQAFTRLLKKTPDLAYRPVEDLAGRLAATDIVLPDGMKNPDVLFRVSTPTGNIWWMGDQFSNSDATDQTWLLRSVARFFGSGLGFRCNSKPELVYVRDRAAWIGSIRSALASAPPSVVVPAHGNPVVRDAAERTRRALDAIDVQTR